jgi:hypothetical protein
MITRINVIKKTFEYGTHYWTDGDCNDCEQYNIGLDVKKWLEAKCIKDGYMEDEDN